MTAEPMHMATTAHGGIFGDFSSSSSKYLMRPAAEWKPSPFFFAMMFVLDYDYSVYNGFVMPGIPPPGLNSACTLFDIGKTVGTHVT
jgi:hypothetical protein